MKRVLLLNSDWSPLNFVSGFRALNLLFKGRAEVITLGEKPSFWEEKLTTPTKSYDIPATLRLVERVNRRYTAPRFRKWVLFNRDSWQCQYCGVKLDWHSITIDHVLPRSRGGPTNWKNCVAACKKCNLKKGSRLLPETGMQLKKNPAEPKVSHFWEMGHSPWHPDWEMFFGSDTYRT
jgi:5-methylcytosine-specific restriction endonuclease McrA